MLFEVKEAKQSKWETNGRRKKNYEYTSIRLIYIALLPIICE